MIAQRDLNATLGILGIFALGIFLVWFPLVVLMVPQPSGLVTRTLFTAVWQTVTTIVMPCAWAVWRLDLHLADLGLSLHNLGHSALLGCALYTLALAAFLHCSNDPLIAYNPVRDLPMGEAIGLTSALCLIAAGTDIATRGFILLTLARHTHVIFAIAVQNLTWFLGHVHEINLLTNCLGAPAAIGLTLTLGVLGDVVALKTRNVVGLAIAHVFLNVALTVYIRHM